VDHTHRLKRGGQVDFVPFDTSESEYRPQLAALDCLTAEKIFDARWALALLDEAMARLAQEYAAQRKTTIFQALKTFLDPINTKISLTYEEVANELHVSVGAVKTLIHRLRKRYTALLREEVGRTVSDPAEIDGEIHALCEALVATEGRLSP
jgi:Sigma-70, region 4